MNVTALKPAPSLPPKRRPKPKVKLTTGEQRTVGQFIAAVAAGFLPVASFVIAHMETRGNPWMWGLVIAGLMFSAPTLADWALKWCKDRWKSWGFTILLEGVMIFSSVQYLAATGLFILVAINCHSAWNLSGKKSSSK